MPTRRVDVISNLIWPLLIIVVAILWMLNTLDALPPVIVDLIQRGWPVLLVAVGLILLIGRRVRFGNLIAVGVSALLAGGVLTISYQREAGRFRTDYTEPIAYTLGPEVTSLRASAVLRQTTIEIHAADPGERVIRGQFIGSLESIVSLDFQVANGIGTFTLQENPRNAIPQLGRVGRGRLTLFVPQGIPLEQLTLTGIDGDLTLDLSAISTKALTIALNSGNLTANFKGEAGLIGDLKTNNGAVTVTIPPTIAAQITLLGPSADSPRYNDQTYILGINKVLVPRRTADPQMQLTLSGTAGITIN